jgi:hypothetical protein
MTQFTLRRECLDFLIPLTEHHVRQILHDGIELLNPNEQLRRDETEKLLLINEATGEHVEFPLATG